MMSFRVRGFQVRVFFGLRGSVFIVSSVGCRVGALGSYTAGMAWRQVSVLSTALSNLPGQPT